MKPKSSLLLKILLPFTLAPWLGADALSPLRHLAEKGPDSLPTGRVAWPRSPTALFDNPAALGGLPGTSLSLSVTPTMLLALTHWHGLIAHPTSPAVSLAAGAYGTAHEPFPGDIGFQGDGGRSITVASSAWVAGLSIGLGSMLRVPWRLDVGVSARLVSSTADGSDLNGFFLDGGLLFSLPHGGGNRELSFGVATRGWGFNPTLASRVNQGPEGAVVGLAYGWTLLKSLQLGASVDGSLFRDRPLTLGFSLEGLLWRVWSLRLGFEPEHALRPFTLATAVRVPLDRSGLKIEYLFGIIAGNGTSHGVHVTLEFPPR